MDPEQLSDALLSAGVDLREEENLLSSSLLTEIRDRKDVQSQIDVADFFLNHKNLQFAVDRAIAMEGLRYTGESDNAEILGLLSAACQDWLAEIVTEASMYSRHRRLSKNDTPSDIAKALRLIAQQDKDNEQQRAALKLSMGIGLKESDKRKDSEEIQHRAANDTALMMTSGGKRYSWLSGTSSGASHSLPSVRRGATEGSRFKEVKEDMGIILKDLLAALSNKRMGVRKVLYKGNVKIKD